MAEFGLKTVSLCLAMYVCLATAFSFLYLKQSNKDSDSEGKESEEDEEDKDKFNSKDFDRLFKGIKKSHFNHLQQRQRPLS